MLVAATLVPLIFSSCEKKETRPVGESKPFPGYTLLNQIASKNSDLIDMEGRVVHRWTSKHGLANGAQLMPNGDLYRTGLIENSPFRDIVPGAGGVIERFDWDGNLLWTYTLADPLQILHHDIEVLPNGNVLVTGLEVKNRKQQIEAGRDPSRIRNDSMWADFVMEVKPTGRSGGEIVWRWNLWDHLIQDVDPKVANYGVVSEHPERVDINFIESPIPINDSRMKLLQSVGYVGRGKSPASSGAFLPDTAHINAISYNPQTDQIMLTSRSLGEIWILDHGTTTEQAAGKSGGRYGQGGGLLFRWGNPQASQLGTPADQKLFGPHDGHWIPAGLPGAGNALVFDNGDGRRDGEYSTIQEIRLPVAADGSYSRKPGVAQGPAAAEWTYTGEPKSSFFSAFLSGVQRLPNANTLICAGVQAEVFEVDRAGRTVWRHKVNKDDSAVVSGGGLSKDGTPLMPPMMPELPMPPLILVLDTDKNGSLSKAEVAAASAQLKTLDANGDGRLTLEECLPMPGGGPGGMPPMGGPGGFPPPGGPGGFPPGGAGAFPPPGGGGAFPPGDGAGGFPPGGPGGPGGFPPGGPGGGPPLPPILVVLDVNSDRVLDADEIGKAAENIGKLDKDADGTIARNEMLPDRPPGGPPGMGGPGGGPGGGMSPFPMQPGGGPGSAPPIPPIVTIFGIGTDGGIAATSIAKAGELLLKLDRDGDGKLSKNEYLPEFPSANQNAADVPAPAAPPDVPPIVSVLDLNGDGTIDGQEIAKASELLIKLDRNRDGRLSLDETLPAPPTSAGMQPPALAGPGSTGQGGLFRATRFGLDFPAFKDRTLAPLPGR